MQQRGDLNIYISCKTVHSVYLQGLFHQLNLISTMFLIQQLTICRTLLSLNLTGLFHTRTMPEFAYAVGNELGCRGKFVLSLQHSTVHIL